MTKKFEPVLSEEDVGDLLSGLSLITDRAIVRIAEQAVLAKLHDSLQKDTNGYRQVLEAVAQQFELYGNRFPDGFDSRVFRWVDDALAAPMPTPVVPEQRGEPLAWIYEDELPDGYPYDAMFPYSEVDVVRLFPIYGPTPVVPAASAELVDKLSLIIAGKICRHLDTSLDQSKVQTAAYDIAHSLATTPAQEPSDDAIGVLKLALEYWADRQQRYRNRAPVWVQEARALLARYGDAQSSVPGRNEIIELLATLLHFIPKDEPEIYQDTERLCASLRDTTPPGHIPGATKMINASPSQLNDKPNCVSKYTEIDIRLILNAVIEFVNSDADAATYQSIGQYRSTLMKALSKEKK